MLRRPYYQIKSITSIPAEGQADTIRSNTILDATTIDDLRRSTLVLSELPGPLPEENVDDSHERTEEPFMSKIDSARHRYHAFYPAYGRTFECQPPHNIK
ncbi:hypothetical protein XU18_2519 [Perkinsela sp. CCAP 1560/4]|nr:hypothetical protein XU18_2519 [Perkinsela sp. CCAP 1560/4]|eukprot:KNH06618.1 hypothetical protein XU18_2519 [Perkinsela sp. CCAP 1560/4]